MSPISRISKQNASRQGSGKKRATKRILAIDGGGIKGTFPASFLSNLEETIGEPIADYFDLIVGTSTGGIIALGLGMGLPARDILDFYEQRGPDIFTGNQRLRTLRQISRAKYRRDPLQAALHDVFGDRLLGESRTRLVIPSLDLETGKVHVFKTAHHPRFMTDYKVGAVEVALATAAAPTYFPTYHSAAGIPLVDGGLWANNPAGLAAVEALGVLNWERGDVKLLSLGCTTEPLRAKANRKHWLGVSYWAPRLLTVMMSGQSSSSHGTAQLLLGHDNVLRYSPSVPNGRFKLDSPAGIDALRGLGASEARQAVPALRAFLDQKADPFEPFYRTEEASL